MQCKHCGTPLTHVNFGQYWAWACLNKECKQTVWPTGKEDDHGQINISLLPRSQKD